MEKIINNEYPNIVAENASIASEYRESSQQLTRDTIFEFLEICKVPHPSQHMQKIRAYLMEWAKQHENLGITAQLDDSGCVIYDVDASEGFDRDGVSYSQYPNVILQAHMDMVASATKDYRHCNYAGNRWDARDDSIPAVFDRTKGIISTENKCSLGADDGQGIATCLAIAKNPHIKHGPLRFLFTYDEEVNMQGVRNLNPKELNANYLINLDSIYVGTVLNSAAGGFEGVLSKHYQLVSAPNNTSLITIRMGGLAGGHSGEDIAKGRGNTVDIAIDIMDALNKQGIQWGIAKLKAGTAMNAIPTTMKMILVVESGRDDEIEQTVNTVVEKARNKYVGGEKLNHTVDFEPSFGALTVTRGDSQTILANVKTIPNGPIDLLEDNTPETSCNIGLFDVREGHVKAHVLYRTCINEKQDQAYDLFKNLADQAKADLVIKAIFPAWSKLENNPLNDLFLKSYEDACGFIGESIDIHSGLECGYLSIKKPGLIMTSIGCDLLAEHTPRETLFTKSMPAFMASLLYVLDNIKNL